MLRMFLGVVALAASVQAVAQAPAAAPADKSQVWDLEWEEPHCTITTATEDGSALMFAMTPGDPDPTLYFMQRGARVPATPGSTVTVKLQPSGKTVEAKAWLTPDRSSRALQISPLGYRFPAEFARSDSVELQTDKGQMSMPIVGADKAMAAIHECIDKKLTEWGLDAAAYDALQKAPTEIKGYSWMDPNDYPMDALEMNWSGNVVARLAVDATGKVTDCKILVSGIPSVDDVTCRSALKKGRYDPAIGPDGKPTAALRIVDVVFTVRAG